MSDGTIAGVPKERFEQEVREIADIAFNDQSTGANLRMPLVTEIEGLPRFRAFKKRIIRQLRCHLL